MTVTKRTTTEEALPFDLNIGTVLEHWTVAFAVREIIANALDEQAITATAEPTITTDADGRWHIADGGRGLRYEHLTQDESSEKRRYPEVIGQFGMGLKDALAVFDRRGVGVEVRSPHGDITTSRRPKDQFADVVTLHAIVGPPCEPGRTGTDVVLSAVTDDDIEQAKRFFLRYSDEQTLEATRYGQVLRTAAGERPARVCVKGLLVAEEENFLFSYNITDLSAPLRRALSRERANVGRGAYSERVKAILQQCTSAAVAGPLTTDLATSGRQHDELGWRDVALHACRALGAHDKVVFITSRQLEEGSPQVRYAKQEGYRLVVVPDDIAVRLAGLTDLSGQPIVDLHRYRQSWNDSFSFSLVDPADLTPAERRVHSLTEPAATVAGFDLARLGVTDVLVSETMRLSETGHEVVGVWDPTSGRVIVRRDQLANPRSYCATLLHELGHARSHATDASLEFEVELTRIIGSVTTEALHGRPAD